MHWCPSQAGFYDPDVHGAAMPADAVEISDALYQDLLAAQALGQQIKDVAGWPVAVDPPQTLATLRAARKAAAQAAFAARIALGMPWGDATVQIDDASQGRISVAVMMAQYGLPDGFTWRMADNSAVPLDAAELVTMARAAGAYVTALRMRYWQIVDAIAAAADAGAVAAVDVDAGWPTASGAAEG